MTECSTENEIMYFAQEEQMPRRWQIDNKAVLVIRSGVYDPQARPGPCLHNLAGVWCLAAETFKPVVSDRCGSTPQEKKTKDIFRGNPRAQ